MTSEAMTVQDQQLPSEMPEMNTSNDLVTSPEMSVPSEMPISSEEPISNEVSVPSEMPISSEVSLPSEMPNRAQQVAASMTNMVTDLVKADQQRPKKQKPKRKSYADISKENLILECKRMRNSLTILKRQTAKLIGVISKSLDENDRLLGIAPHQKAYYAQKKRIRRNRRKKNNNKEQEMLVRNKNAAQGPKGNLYEDPTEVRDQMKAKANARRANAKKFHSGKTKQVVEQQPKAPVEAAPLTKTQIRKGEIQQARKQENDRKTKRHASKKGLKKGSNYHYKKSETYKN